MKLYFNLSVACVFWLLLMSVFAFGQSGELNSNIYNPGNLKPRDSELKVKAGQPAPDFTLPAISGNKISLSQYRGQKNVVLSFVPAAFTPVCSDQWPGYNIVKEWTSIADPI